MGDHLHVALPLQHLQHPEIDACGLKIGGFQNDSYPITGAARLIDGVDLPAALHLQMRMDAGLADADEQVLTAADDFVDHVAGEVDGGVARHPDIAPGQRLADECVAQDGSRVPDGIALRHISLNQLQRQSPESTSFSWLPYDIDTRIWRID